MRNILRIHVLAGLALALLIPTVAGAVDPAPQTQAATGKDATVKTTAAKPVQPAHIQVQHILIGFKGSVPGKPITRTQAEAKKLAYDILKSARKGVSFDELVKQHTDDQAPGIYGMSNTDVEPAAGEHARGGMVPAFGNVGFVLKVGKIGIANYDQANSPYGWHIIKRLK